MPFPPGRCPFASVVPGRAGHGAVARPTAPRLRGPLPGTWNENTFGRSAPPASAQPPPGAVNPEAAHGLRAAAPTTTGRRLRAAQGRLRWGVLRRPRHDPAPRASLLSI